ncbi:hypothetical protein [Streptomyces sp. NPDC049040]|uniref:hypothetical protein n=1 Tax=Streptomyces sp. NPDC049040 TaxID=3365593 RepID=UPI003721415D
MAKDLNPHSAPNPLPTHMSWDLLHWHPETAAMDDSPVVVIWHLQLEGTPKG